MRGGTVEHGPLDTPGGSLPPEGRRRPKLLPQHPQVLHMPPSYLMALLNPVEEGGLGTCSLR